MKYGYARVSTDDQHTDLQGTVAKTSFFSHFVVSG